MGSSADDLNAPEPQPAGQDGVFFGTEWVVAREDLYCPSCGYNLRGLMGDPLRCPECGTQTALHELIIPARAITRVLRLMEGSPTACVGCAIGFLTCILLASVPIPGPPMIEIIVAAFCLLGWFAARARMRQVFANQPGWAGVLRDFHVAALFAILPLSAMVAYCTTGFREGRVVFLAAPATVVCLIVFGRVYSRARAEIARLQRAAAVRIAAGSVDLMV